MAEIDSLTYRRYVDWARSFRVWGSRLWSIVSCQLAEQNYAGQATVHLVPASNPLSRTSEPSIVFVDHDADDNEIAGSSFLDPSEIAGWFENFVQHMLQNHFVPPNQFLSHKHRPGSWFLTVFMFPRIAFGKKSVLTPLCHPMFQDLWHFWRSISWHSVK